MLVALELMTYQLNKKHIDIYYSVLVTVIYCTYMHIHSKKYEQKKCTYNSLGTRCIPDLSKSIYKKH